MLTVKALSYVVQGLGVVLAVLGFGGDLSGGPSVYDQTAGFPTSFIAWGIGLGGVWLFLLGRRVRERRGQI
jgi:hypothetical protein